MSNYRVFLLALTAFMFTTPLQVSVGAKEDSSCNVHPLGSLQLSDETGELVYVTYEGGIRSLTAYSIQSTTDHFQPELSGVGSWLISPDGLHIAGSYIPDFTSNVSEVVVFNRSGQVVYQGASSAGAGDIHWLKNDEIVKLAYIRSPRDSSLKSYFQTTIFIIDPFKQTFTTYTPDYDSFFYDNDNPIMAFQRTYDGRYMLSAQGTAYDFVEAQIVELENYRYGVPSLSSHKFLVFDYSSLNNLPQTRISGPHPVLLYNLESDSLREVSSLATDRPVNIYAFDNSWSPDENLWAYIQDYEHEIVFRPIEILQLSSGEKQSTCFGQFYTTDISAFSKETFATGVRLPDFAWSRDSRYLAMQAVIKGQDMEDMEESFGVYIYDTQTAEIYEVYRGQAGIVGWMSN